MKTTLILCPLIFTKLRLPNYLLFPGGDDDGDVDSDADSDDIDGGGTDENDNEETIINSEELELLHEPELEEPKIDSDDLDSK